MLEPWAYRHRRWKKWPCLKLFGQRQLDSAAAVLAASQIEARHLARFARSTPVCIAPPGRDEELPLDRTQARPQLGIPDRQTVAL